MPIHDLGYRPWQGKLTAPVLRFTAIAETGIATVVLRRRQLILAVDG